MPDELPSRVRVNPAPDGWVSPAGCSAKWLVPMTYSMTVISIQSQVAYGHVGNSAAVFPMQMRGIDVIAVTNHFAEQPAGISDHPGQDSRRGSGR